MATVKSLIVFYGSRDRGVSEFKSLPFITQLSVSFEAMNINGAPLRRTREKSEGNEPSDENKIYH